SIARFFQRLCPTRIDWIRSYPAHPAFIASYTQTIQNFLLQKGLLEKECFFFFSAHGIPQSFVQQGDPYEQECLKTYHQLRSQFPQSLSYLAYQSRFGKKPWLQPYTDESCHNILHLIQDKKHVVFIPLT